MRIDLQASPGASGPGRPCVRHGTTGRGGCAAAVAGSSRCQQSDDRASPDFVAVQPSSRSWAEQLRYR